MFTILCDIDNIIYDTTANILKVHYEDTGELLTLDDIKSYYIENYVSPQYRKDFHKIFVDKRVWRGVQLLPDCVETIRKLHEAHYEIFFVTATETLNAHKKYTFLCRTFPFLDVRKHFITTHNKQMIKGDVLIDDCGDNVINGDYYGVLFDYPWNRDIDMDKHQNVFRVNGWSDVFETVQFLEKWKKWERRIKNELRY